MNGGNEGTMAGGMKMSERSPPQNVYVEGMALDILEINSSKGGKKNAEREKKHFNESPVLRRLR